MPIGILLITVIATVMAASRYWFGRAADLCVVILAISALLGLTAFLS